MKSLIIDAAQTILLAVIVFLLLQVSVQNFQVEMSSMSPTIKGGQRILVNKLVYRKIPTGNISRFVPFWEERREKVNYAFHPPRRGEIVVFRLAECNPVNDCIKRVIAEPGDTITIQLRATTIDGEPSSAVILNGELLNEPYIVESWDTYMSPLTLGPDEYFVMGDNRNFSRDSRAWGPLSSSDFIGKAWVAYLPFSNFTFFNSVAPFHWQILNW